MGLKLQSGGIKRNFVRVKQRCTHVDGDTAIRGEARLDDALHGLHTDHVLVRQRPVMHKAGKTTRAVATLLDLGAVGVVDQVFKVDARRGRGPHGQDLVGTDAKVAVTQEAVMGLGEAQAATGFVQHNKIVAGPLHFGERNAHGVDYQPSVSLHWPLLQNAGMVRPHQRLHTHATPPSSEAPDQRTGLLGGVAARFLQHDTVFGELALVCPTGTEPHHALDWQSERPVHLLRNVQRLTAPNPGFMTGPGTNSYLVGDSNTGFIVIDPGPADADHVQRLWRAAIHPDGSGGNIQMVVCTHSHADHSPGAKPLQALCATQPPILGLPSAPTARAASLFKPDRSLSNGEQLALISRGLEAIFAYSHTLQVIHTPGHAANHVCLLLVEDGLLFSGDHILNGSTTVIDPPDGHMGDYLRSLDTLLAACAQHDVHFILPAHGHVLGGSAAAASGVITHLKAHRLTREAKIAAVMAAHPQGTLDDWLPLAYDDVDARVWPVAKRSLLAHVEHIQGLNTPNDKNKKDTAL